jgi:hypothetical protein
MSIQSWPLLYHFLPLLYHLVLNHLLLLYFLLLQLLNKTFTPIQSRTLLMQLLPLLYHLVLLLHLLLLLLQHLLPHQLRLQDQSTQRWLYSYQRF